MRGALNDGSPLCKRGDVVTVNHRLNVFDVHYLTCLDGAEPGDAGALGLVAAPKGVHDNPARVDGNPGNVTIFGQSGSAAKVSGAPAWPLYTMGDQAAMVVDNPLSVTNNVRSDEAALLCNLPIMRVYR